MIPDDVFRKTVSGERIFSHIRALEGERHPVTSPEALERAADYITASLQESGCAMSEHHFTWSGRPYRNVIGTRRGLLHPDELVILLAHYDTVQGSPGADDNASGIAVLLETARTLEQYSFERTILFIAVSLEENQDDQEHSSGLLGSRALARHARENGWAVKGVYVLESVAYAGDDVGQRLPQGVPVPVPETGNFLAAIGNERSMDLLRAFAASVQHYGAGLCHVPLAVPGNGELLPDTRRSDHAPFWDEGFPAIMLTDTTNFRNPHYHRPTDTLPTLNREFAARVCCATAGAMFGAARPMG